MPWKTARTLRQHVWKCGTGITKHEVTLYEAQKGNSYRIEGLSVEPDITRRLQALGLNDGTVVNVLNRKKHGALIIQVRGTRLALGKHISSHISVKGMKIF